MARLEESRMRQFCLFLPIGPIGAIRRNRSVSESHRLASFSSPSVAKT